MPIFWVAVSTLRSVLALCRDPSVSFRPDPMQPLSRILRLGGMGLAFACLPAALAQTSPAPPAATPLQAQVTDPLDITHLQPGKPFFLRVPTPWHFGECSLLPGSMVRGHLVALTRRSRVVKNSSFELAIDQADCKNAPGKSPALAIIAAVRGPQMEPDLVEGPPLSNDLPLSLGGGLGGDGMRRLGDATAVTDSMQQPIVQLPATIKPGELINLPRMHLDVHLESGGTALFTAAGKDARLDPGTTLVLLANAQSVLHKAVTSAGSSSRHVAATAAGPGSSGAKGAGAVSLALTSPEPADVTAVCDHDCTTQGSDAATTGAGEQLPAGVVSLDSLGLRPAGSREMTHLNRNAALLYLDNEHLLCTFDPHLLRHRTDLLDEPARTIRALVVNTGTHRIDRVFNWRVRGAGQYLWRLAPDHLLVHVGKELQELDAHLDLVRTLPLDGRLAWVSVSPSGSHLAIGIIRERYSDEFKQQLTQLSSAEELEEDIEVRLYDRQMHELLHTMRTSRMPAPVLSANGETRTHRESAGRWQIATMDWTQHEHALAVARTACRPDMVSLAGDLVFMLGCNSTGARWYRILRQDGHPLLKADAGSGELEQAATGSLAGPVAIRVLTCKRALGPGEPFRPEDLTAEHVAVYNQENGARLATISPPDFALSEQNFALSPDGRQLALLGQSTVRFYGLPSPPSKR